MKSFYAQVLFCLLAIIKNSLAKSLPIFSLSPSSSNSTSEKTAPSTASLTDILQSIETVAILGADALNSIVETQIEVQDTSAKIYNTAIQSKAVSNAITSKMAFFQIISNLIGNLIRMKIEMGQAAICIIGCLFEGDPLKILECKRRSNCISSS